MTVTRIEIEQEIDDSFVEYAMAVITSRALPDVRDGLKPVHRRILYSMFDNQLTPDRPHVKCAKVVGDVMSRFHPHGDSSIYDALVRMAQKFSMRVPLVDGHGNFGSPDPSAGAAASRYTECRLTVEALSMLDEIHEDTVDFEPNYDSQSTEPIVLPAKIPNLLVNGAQGIAVGMATSIASHNLDECIEAAQMLVKNPKLATAEILEIITGPDFPTGGIVIGDLTGPYESGKGTVKLRAKTDIVDNEIIVTEIPYQTSVEVIKEQIARLDLPVTILDASAHQQIELRIICDNDDPEHMLAVLLGATSLEVTFSINHTVLVDGVPQTLGIRDILRHFVDHRRNVIRRRSEYRLAKATARLHIVEGLILCISMIDWVVNTIRSSESRQEARELLGEHFSPEQTEYILDLQLGRITKLGAKDLEAEAKALAKQIEALNKILGSTRALNTVLIKELDECRSGESRRTAVGTSDLIMPKKLIDRTSTVKSFSSLGRVHAAAHSMEIGEELIASLDLDGVTHVGFVTEQGMFKKSTAEELLGVSRKVFPALKLKEGDRVVQVLLDPEKIPTKTKTGRTKMFDATKVRPTGRTSIGVRVR
jgi:DNA gyrase subunit A